MAREDRYYAIRFRFNSGDEISGGLAIARENVEGDGHFISLIVYDRRTYRIDEMQPPNSVLVFYHDITSSLPESERLFS